MALWCDGPSHSAVADRMSAIVHCISAMVLHNIEMVYRISSIVHRITAMVHCIREMRNRFSQIVILHFLQLVLGLVNWLRGFQQK